MSKQKDLGSAKDLDRLGRLYFLFLKHPKKRTRLLWKIKKITDRVRADPSVVDVVKDQVHVRYQAFRFLHQGEE